MNEGMRPWVTVAALSLMAAGCFPTFEPFPDGEAPADGDTDADNDADVDVPVDGGGDAEADAALDADEEELEDGDIDATPDGDIDVETDSDADGDVEPDGDPDVETEGPMITAVDGTGPEQDVAPREEDLDRWEGVPEADRRAAEHRIDSAAPVLVVSGENLAGTTAAIAERVDGEDTIEFEIEERTMTSVRLRFPAVLGVAAGGLFMLTLTTPLGDANAQVFFLQGEQGPPGDPGPAGEDGADGRDGVDGDSLLDCVGDTCTLAHDLVVEGDIAGVNGTYSGDLDVTGAGTFDTLEVNDLRVLRSVWLPECPSGYERDMEREDIILCVQGRDEMVKVGDFWVDRYEASVWADAECTTGIEDGVPYGSSAEDYPPTFPDNGSFTEPLYSCSVSGVTPSRWLTWFQAQAACTAAGKSLITNAEWQAAVEGTYDPGSSSVDRGVCLTSSDDPRPSGWAGGNPGGDDSCISIWGAEDMIGNLSELTSDWWPAGRAWMMIDEDDAEPWPDGYSRDNEDFTQNLNGQSQSGYRLASGLPSVALRGGHYGNGTNAGAFALDLRHGTSYPGYTIGFRCVIH